MSLRDRKRARTRQALIDAATTLFTERGYDGTTIADLAEAADIGTRTFFSYFRSKEQLLFPDAEERVRAALDAIATRADGEGPADVLLRGLNSLGDGDDLVTPLAALRIRLARTVPAVSGYGLQLQLDAQRQIARALAAEFPDRLDGVSAGALTGAFVGAITGALQALLDGPDGPAGPAALRAAVRTATSVALGPWLRQVQP